MRTGFFCVLLLCAFRRTCRFCGSLSVVCGWSRFSWLVVPLTGSCIIRSQDVSKDHLLRLSFSFPLVFQGNLCGTLPPPPPPRPLCFGLLSPLFSFFGAVPIQLRLGDGFSCAQNKNSFFGFH
eukprot:RCo026085